MAKPMGGSGRITKLLLGIPLGILLFSKSVAATATSVSIAQQPATSSPNATTTDEQQAFARAQQLFEQAQQLRQQGTAESQQQALVKYEEALKIWQQLAVNEAPPYVARSFEAMTFLSIGNTYYGMNELQKAVDSFNRGLAISREVKNRLQDVIARTSADNAGSNSNKKQELLDWYKQALVQTSLGEASLLDSLGNAYYSLGEMQKAIKYHNQALSLFRAEKQPLRESITLGNIADAYFSLGETQKSLDFYNRALEIQRAEKHTVAQVMTLQTIGLRYTKLGESQQALAAYNQALELQREKKDLAGQAYTLSRIGSLYYSLGEYQKAMDSYNQALQLQQAAQGNLSGTDLASNLSEEAAILMGIAGTYASWGLGDPAKALDFYNQARSLFQKAGNRFGEASVLYQISLIYKQLAEKQKALDVLNQSLVLWRAIPDPEREAFSLREIANIYNSMGEPQQALDFYNQALDIQRRLNARSQQGITLYSIGDAYSSLGDYQLSIDTYNQALEIFKSLGDRTGEAETLYNVAITQRDRDNLNEALTQIKEVIKIVEDIRTRVTSQELRTSYFASVQKYYQFYIDVLMQLHKQDPSKGYDALALHASERARARSLLELLTEANANIRQGVEPKLLEQERTLQQKLDAVEKRRIELFNGQYTNTQVEALEKETTELLAEYRQVQEQIRRTSPRYAALTQPQPLTLAEIQQQVLDDDTMLLEYSLGEERSYLWAVTKTSTTSYELPKREEIEAAAKEFYQFLKNPAYRLGTRGGLGVEGRPGSSVGNDEAAIKLSQMLIAPVAAQLGNKRLLIVSDGALQYLPFAALPTPSTPLAPLIKGGIQGKTLTNSPLSKGGWGGKEGVSRDLVPLLVEYEIVNLPSASTLGVLRQELSDRQSAAKAIAVLADPVFGTNDPRLTSSSGQVSGSPIDK